MRFRDFSFALVMCFLTLATAYRYGAVKRFVRDSKEYTFFVEADRDRLKDMKSRLRGATFQSVGDEMVEDGLYRITVKCPPENLGIIWSMVGRMSERRGE